jgi:hypothetical protein
MLLQVSEHSGSLLSENLTRCLARYGFDFRAREAAAANGEGPLTIVSAES